MLTLGITLFLLSLVIAGFGVMSTIGTGAIAFSVGFMVLAAVSLLSYWRGHPAP